MDKTETGFLKTQELQPFVWLRYIDDIFFIWIHGETELKKFMEGLNNFLPNLQFTYEASSSSHPDHLKSSIIYSQALRLSNICTYEGDFDKHALNMKSWFLEGGYSKQMIDSQMGKVKFGQKLKAGSKQVRFGVLFVITYHPRLKKLMKIMKKLEHLLYQYKSIKRVFTPPPMVSYRSARKLSSYLVLANLYP